MGYKWTFLDGLTSEFGYRSLSERAGFPKAGKEPKDPTGNLNTITTITKPFINPFVCPYMHNTLYKSNK